ncbi:alpha/beta hydrolase, partial [Streptomyces sp. NPDC057273]
MSAAADRRRAGTYDDGALVLRSSPAEPKAAVLLLHGGRADGPEPPPALNLPALRMRPFAAAVVRATRGADVLVAEVRYRHRGWNGDRCDAARDAAAALARVRKLVGEVPVVLMGHSMG